MEADSSDSTHYLQAELGVSFNPDTFDSLVDSMSTPDLAIDTSSSLNESSPSPPLAAASESTTEDKSKKRRNKKTEGLTEEEAEEKRRIWNKQERERQRALKIAFEALRRILPENSMSRHEKSTKIWILETAMEYIGALTIQVNRLKETKDLPVLTAPSAPPMSANIPAPPMSANIPVPPMSANIPAPPMSANIPVPPMSANIPAPPMSANIPVPPMSANIPVPPMSANIPAPPMSANIPAPPMSANIPVPPMNPMPDTLVSQPLATVHQNEQVPFFGQQNLSIDQATRHQPTVASKPEHFIYDGSSNPTCLWGGLNPSHQTTIQQDHTPGPHSSHPMNVPIQTELYPGESHMGPRHPNHGPPMVQPEFSAPSFSPYNLPALASSIDCSPILPTPHGHNFFYSTPQTHIPSPAYPTPITNRIMSDSGYSGTASSSTFNSSTNSSKSSKSRRRKKSTTFSPYSQDRTYETISFTYQPY